jgi:G6PDH family F420-dependent oxidoreductase
VTSIPVGVNLSSIGVTTAWWLDSARAVEEAGFEAVWIWDHFVSRGRLDDPVLECWTMLAAAAVATSRVRLGPFVTNVMNRHPAVLARMAATVAELSGGRLELGIGAGGHPAEHEAYGIDFPPRPQRAEHLVEAIELVRRLFRGGPVDFEGRHYRLDGAHAFPVPDPPPRLVLGGETAAGARMAARYADAWTCFGGAYERLLPRFEEELAAAGRERTEVPILVGLDIDDVGDDLAALAAAWRGQGAAELIIHDVKPWHLEGLLRLR